jgi:hypothetical protein
MEKRINSVNWTRSTQLNVLVIYLNLDITRDISLHHTAYGPVTRQELFRPHTAKRFNKLLTFPHLHFEELPDKWAQLTLRGSVSYSLLSVTWFLTRQGEIICSPKCIIPRLFYKLSDPSLSEPHFTNNWPGCGDNSCVSSSYMRNAVSSAVYCC